MLYIRRTCTSSICTSSIYDLLFDYVIENVSRTTLTKPFLHRVYSLAKMYPIIISSFLLSIHHQPLPPHLSRSSRSSTFHLSLSCSISTLSILKSVDRLRIEGCKKKTLVARFFSSSVVMFSIIRNLIAFFCCCIVRPEHHQH